MCLRESADSDKGLEEQPRQGKRPQLLRPGHGSAHEQAGQRGGDDHEDRTVHLRSAVPRVVSHLMPSASGSQRLSWGKELMTASAQSSAPRIRKTDLTTRATGMSPMAAAT